jgi:hypothetical protein
MDPPRRSADKRFELGKLGIGRDPRDTSISICDPSPNVKRWLVPRSTPRPDADGGRRDGPEPDDRPGLQYWPESRQVTNRMDPLTDHGGYLTNDEEVFRRIAAEIDTSTRSEPPFGNRATGKHHRRHVLTSANAAHVLRGSHFAARVQQIVGTQLQDLIERPSTGDIERWRHTISDKAREAAGLAYATYIRSKVSGVVDRYSSTICRLCAYPDESNLAAFVYAVLREWARERLFPERNGRRQPADNHVDFLRTFDLEFGTRRVQFVIDALSWWYACVRTLGYPTRGQ